MTVIQCLHSFMPEIKCMHYCVSLSHTVITVKVFPFALTTCFGMIVPSFGEVSTILSLILSAVYCRHLELGLNILILKWEVYTPYIDKLFLNFSVLTIFTHSTRITHCIISSFVLQLCYLWLSSWFFILLFDTNFENCWWI